MRQHWKQDKLQKGISIVSKEPGNSMLPLIKHRQPVVLSPCKIEDVDVGDIVYCCVRGTYYTHRVTAKNDRRGLQISNNLGHVNGWTKKVYGKVTKILND